MHRSVDRLGRICLVIPLGVGVLECVVSILLKIASSQYGLQNEKYFIENFRKLVNLWEVKASKKLFLINSSFY